MQKEKTYKCQSLSLNLIITTVIYGGIVLVGMINTKGYISQSSLIKIILGAILLLILSFWSSVFISLNNQYLIIKYPFKFPYKRSYSFILKNITKIYIKDPKDGRFSQQKIEIHYKEEDNIKIYSLGNNIRNSKIQHLINLLRERGIEVDIRGSTLKY